MNFYIMNKNIVVAEFICTSDMGVEQSYIKEILRQDLLPLSLKNGYNFLKWLDDRLVLTHRKNVTEAFKQLGIYTTADILQITKGISLNDTYWIKEINSKQSWASVSPYRNPLNKIITEYSFDENKKVFGKNIGSSPDFATSGQFPKCWKRINNVIYLIKGGSTFGMNSGNEPFSELFANELLSRITKNYVSYTYIKYKNVDATKCANMCTEELGIYPLHYVRPDIIGFASLLQQYNYDKYLLDMLLFDYLSLNTDRHWGNISIYVNNDTQQILGFTPIYDNNLAFLPYYVPKMDKTIDNYISNVNGHITTSDGTSFEDLFRMIDCKYVREKVSSLKNFRISSKYKRSDVANRVLKRQLSLIPSK